MQIEPSSQTIARIPSAGAMLLRAAITRKQEQSEPELNPSELRVFEVKADKKQLALFNEVCEFTPSEFLPITFPQVMSTALQIQLMLQPEFPFNPIGSVHLRNEIIQLKKIPVSEPLDFAVSTRPMRRTLSGYEIDFVTRAEIDNETVWQVIATVLIRRKLDGANTSKKQHTSQPKLVSEQQWVLDENLGRRYARASGDYNPIHLYPLTARALGFKRQIAHGMWSKSRCLAELLPNFSDGPIVARAAFKLPIYLPTTVTMMHEPMNEAVRFELRGPNGRRPHLIGSIEQFQSQLTTL